MLIMKYQINNDMAQEKKHINKLTKWAKIIN